MPIQLIDPHNPANIHAINALVRDQIAFPDIDYQYFRPLNRPTGRSQAAHTYAINQGVPLPITSALGPTPFAVQNPLGRISNHIFEWIHEYKTNHTLAANVRNELLKKIFVWIHIWGGKQNGRHVFQNWPFYYDEALYTAAIAQISGCNYIGANNTLSQLQRNRIGISFATKHIYFWSKASAPTFDSKVSTAVFSRTLPNSANYPRYLGALDELTAQLPYPTDRKTIERNLFSFLDTPAGENWLELRG